MTTTTQKLTGIDAIYGTLTRGSSGDQVKALQEYLRGNGHPEIKPDGFFGPMTEAAVKDLQGQMGVVVDGKFGPQSLAAAKSYAGSDKTLPGTKTQEEIDAEYSAGVANHPIFAGNSKEALDYAINSGDFSGILDQYGKPFTSADQAAAFAQASDALAPGFNIEKQKDTADVEANLAQQQLDYQKWLEGQGEQFQTDKTTLDQNAADNGVLFSGGRVQKEKNLADTYKSDQAYKLATLGSNIGDTARTYQSAYGDKAANNLSKYYGANSNIYNPKVATGGVKTGGLSSLYNASGLGYQGSKVVANTAAAQARAAGLLWNKGNKLVGTGNQNKY